MKKTKHENRRARALREQLERNGYTKVTVTWEPIGAAGEMCGHSGGYMATADGTVLPLGLSFVEASYNAALYKPHKVKS